MISRFLLITLDKMKQGTFFFWVLFLISVFSQNVYAIYYSLSEEQIKQAIEYGKKNKETDDVTFLDEWVSVSDDGYEWAVVYTKFSTVAYEARQALLASRKLSEKRIVQIISDREDTLSFHVILYGDSPDFAKDYYAVLVYKDKPVQPVMEKNDIRAGITGIGPQKSKKYRAVCRYGFPNYCIESDAEVRLVIIDPIDGNRSFTFKLGEMR